jgi:hypothetical protein
MLDGRVDPELNLAALLHIQIVLAQDHVEPLPDAVTCWKKIKFNMKNEVI